MSDANRSGIGNSDNVWNDAKFMLSANSRKLTAFGICGLFLCLTILSVVSNPQEDAIKLEEKSDVFRTSNSANLNINGSESGSIFSNSVLDIGSSGPVVILNNGIEFAITYFVMLLSLFFTGAGRFVSIDYWIAKCCRDK
ncbi:MAG: hypothetical protein QGF77_03055 [Candidatus Thalassarchaeaceae archaeon]|nr:hypothetical protein [Candidatus Thalassarchaeaceae archaeon]